MDTVAYFLGHPGIDKQHTVLFGLFDKCRRAIEANDTKAVEIVVRDMAKYAIEHFRYEEEMMIHTQYSSKDYNDHILQHALFKSKMLEVMKRTNDLSGGIELLDYIQKWFLSHVLVFDKKLVEYIHQIG